MANQAWAPQSPDLSAYAPQSPDLSSLKHNPNSATSWAPQSPDIAGLNSYKQDPYHEANNHNHIGHNYPAQPTHFSLDGAGWDQKQQGFGAPYASDPSYQTFSPQQPTSHPHLYPNDMPSITRSQRVKHEDQDWAPDNHYHPPPMSIPQYQDIKPPAPSRPRGKMDTRGIEVKTKFPTARIKRIMQADEDVGKVAQVTPVVMAKALELFMIRLITASADIAKSRNSKRVQTAHMKQAVMADDQFDNLREIVGKVPDAPAKKSAAGKDSDSEDGEDAPKKRKKSTAAGGARGKKRRGSDEAEAGA
ncbi:histone-fold-containing protein [Myriangium duriaei CBS 260.36]|uniref:NCT transcriptional regulatory complex subunit A n=1 Tax=Myriangium duriaei CBS 260.36 TaxID=1168546 RepID=A0A9P4MDK4_9PEZI|nr:histone-fold-containing protein [Myriangium duriaei CBS 260.36]